MQLRQLEYFSAVADQLNFRKAAELLYVTQPLLSKQIADMEHELGQKLFIRNTRQVQLTPAGAALKREADSILRQVALVSQSVRRATAETAVTGVLKIGYEESFSRDVLVELLCALRTRCPGLEVDLQEMKFNQCIQMLREQRLDCAFVYLPDKMLSTHITCRVIKYEAICMVAARDKIKENTLEEYLDLAQNEAIYLLEKNPKGINLMGNILHGRAVAPEFRFVESLRTMLLYAAIGNGVGIAPKSFYETHRSPDIAALDLPDNVAQLCMACAWNDQHADPLRSLLLDECPTCEERCADCPTVWCKCHPG